VRDILRLLVPDVVVVTFTLLAVIVNSLVLRAYRKAEPQELVGEEPSSSAATAEPINLDEPQEGKGWLAPDFPLQVSFGNVDPLPRTVIVHLL